MCREGTEMKEARNLVRERRETVAELEGCHPSKLNLRWATTQEKVRMPYIEIQAVERPRRHSRTCQTKRRVGCRPRPCSCPCSYRRSWNLFGKWRGRPVLRTSERIWKAELRPRRSSSTPTR